MLSTGGSFAIFAEYGLYLLIKEVWTLIRRTRERPHRSHRDHGDRKRVCASALWFPSKAEPGRKSKSQTETVE